MERLYATYNDMIEFVIVYIREAHPEMLKKGNKTGIEGRPENIDERLILATQCVSQYKFTIPMVIDGMDGTINKDYQAAPVRVTITDKDGKVAYYAGRGPFDFRLSKVEKVLKKLTANKGCMPPPPEAVWGKSVHGLRCGLSLDPQRLRVGEEVAVFLKFENTTKKPLYLLYNAYEAHKNLVFENDRGETLTMEPSGRSSMFSRMMRRGGRGSRIRPRKIEPGEIYQSEVEGKIVAATDAVVVGRSKALFSFEINDEALADVRQDSSNHYWTGTLTSGPFTFDVSLPLKRACIDCHGNRIFHHEEELDCTLCHVGEEGSEDFDINRNACSQCHPREGMQGRRQILGPEGEFDHPFVHISGEIEDTDCLKCHDHSQHQIGVVRLIDPRSNGKKPWTGTISGFCLTCHNGNPPADVSFPKPKGSGFDKSAFSGTADARKGKSCLDCHQSHGSPIQGLLKEEDCKSPHMLLSRRK